MDGQFHRSELRLGMSSYHHPPRSRLPPALAYFNGAAAEAPRSPPRPGAELRTKVEANGGEERRGEDASKEGGMCRMGDRIDDRRG